MQLLPRTAFAMLSPFEPAQASERLSAATTAPFSFDTYPEPRPFSGRVNGTSFDVMRTSRGRNSFRPRIRGTIESSIEGSRIRGTMRLHEAVVMFLGFVVLGPMWLFIQLVLTSIESGRWDPRIFAIPAAVVALIAIMRFAFVYESRRALRELAMLLQGEMSASRS